jgi:hypothetical protein
MRPSREIKTLLVAGTRTVFFELDGQPRPVKVHDRTVTLQFNAEEVIMVVNVGSIDRVLRIVVGIAVLSLFFVLQGNARYWGLVGFVPLLTGVFRFCPAYSLIGVNTCPMTKGKS